MKSKRTRNRRQATSRNNGGIMTILEQVNKAADKAREEVYESRADFETDVRSACAEAAALRAAVEKLAATMDDVMSDTVIALSEIHRRLGTDESVHTVAMANIRDRLNKEEPI